METRDAEIVRGYLGGESLAIDTVDGWIRRAAWPFQRRLGNRWDDTLQEVRLEITRLLVDGKFRGESSLKTYLWRVVGHTCLDQLRSLSRWKWEDLEDIDGADSGSGVLAALAASGPSIADSRVHRDLLLRVLDRVPSDCRDLWKMLFEGRSYREMSERLGVAEGTLRVRVLRCRDRAAQVRGELLGTTSSRSGNTPRQPTPKSVGGNANDL